jgi:titin
LRLRQALGLRAATEQGGLTVKPNAARSAVLAGVAIVAAGLLPGAASASTYSVTSTADAGPGTLRQAIVDANSHPGADAVRFNLPGPGLQTIAITSAALPAVSQTVVINGRSQPGFAGTPLVRVDNASGQQLDGLRIAAGGSEVLGLELTRFAVAVRLAGDANRVQGNLIGTNAAGDAGLGNATGVRVESGADNRIGGIASSAPNVVSGNTNAGVEIVGSSTTATTVSGNRIGTDPAGMAARANSVGVRVGGGSTQNVIGGTATNQRNLISGNQQYGVRITDSDTAHNTVEGNYVGTTADGSSALSNGVGIRLEGGASQNTIGGNIAEARNVISGNAAVGVQIVGAGSTANTVAGDYIGTGPAGTSKLANGTGVRLASGASANTIGGSTAGAGNVISGNTGNGVEFLNTGTTDNTVAGNYIGTDATGSAALGNRKGVYVPVGPNTIGIPGAGNVISGNNSGGVEITSRDNVVAANYIGTDASGTTAIHQGWGVSISHVVFADNTVGGTTPGAGNVISGNGTGVALGVTTGNMILGNYIGTDATGTAELGNLTGVSMFRGTGNKIGGTTAGAGNVISANSGVGVNMDSTVGNVVAGNYIGTDANGSAELGNGDGVVISAHQYGGDSYSATGNTIGGSTAGARNVISGNTGYGVTLDGGDTNHSFTGNVVRGNYIGTNAAGDAALPNGGGVQVLEGRNFRNNTIGGSATGQRNVISGNAGWGVVLSANMRNNGTSDSNSVVGNYIGTKSGGGHALGNGAGGVRLELGVREDSVEANRIAFNGGPGVLVDGAPHPKGFVASGNSILGNSIFNNAGLGIDLINGGNHDQAAPAITSVTTNGGSTTIDGTLDSTPSTSFRVELFSSPSCDPSGAGEGKTFLGSVDATTDGAGHATFSSSVPALPAGQAVTATATNSATGDTSEFSSCFTSP